MKIHQFRLSYPSLKVFILSFILVAGTYNFKSYAQNPLTPEKAYSLGQRAFEQKKLDSCAYYFEMARQLYTKNRINNYALSTYKCAYCKMIGTEMLEAIPYYEEVIELSDQLSLKPHHFQVHHGSHLDLAYIYYVDKQHEKSNQIIEELFKILETDSSDHTLHNYLAGLGMLIYNTFQLNDYKKAEIEINKAITTIDTISLSNKTEGFIKNIGSIYSSIGDYYGRIGRYSSFKKYQELQLNLLEKHLKRNDINLAWPLTGIGNYHYHFGYYHESLDYYTRALFLLEANQDTLNYRYAYIHDDIAEIYDHLEDFDKALYHINKSVKVYSVQPHLILDYYKSIALKGSIHAALGDTSKAYENAAIATKVFETHPDRTTFIHDILLNVVNTYESLGEFDKALTHAHHMLRLGKIIFPNRSFEVAQDYHSIANLYKQLGNYNNALNYIDSARTANLNEDVEVILPIIQTSIESLEIEILNKVENQDEEYLVSKIQGGSQYINSVKIQIENEINPTYQPVAFYTNSVDLCYSLYQKSGNEKYIKLAFQLSEKSRSFDLKNFIKKSEALEVAKINGVLMDKKKGILDEVNNVKYNLALENTNENPAKKLSLKNQYDSLTREYQIIIKEIANKSPEYFAYKYDTSAIDLEKLERLLSESKTQMVSYFVSKESLYRFEISDRGWNMTRKLWDDNSENEIMNFRSSISSPQLMNNFQQLSNQLYEYLLDTLVSPNLVIIPDHVLNYIPFELLSNQNEDYLLEQSLVRYAYSAETFLKKKSQYDGEKHLLAMAPEFTGGTPTFDVVRSSISPLPFASEEAQNVSKIMQGDYVLGIEATETIFRNRSNQYSTLHLSTHAIVDDSDPSQSRLIFSLEGDSINDGYLHAFEIYNLDLNAQLVTLSACNTGFGKIKKGEGVMSLSRAFAYAGVPATIVSLWPASDRSTSELMKYFYQNLNEGQSKDIALNNARKSYLAVAEGKARHPFYWGGFVLIGDNSPIERDSNSRAYFILFAILIIGIAIYKFKFSKK